MASLQSRPCLVLYGSMTGNSEEIARRVHAGALERGIKASLKECNQYKKGDLEAHSVVVFVASTTGDGDMPENCEKFVRFIKRKSRAADLYTSITYAVCGLGDTNYSKYQACPKLIIKRMGDLGASPFLAPCFIDEGTGGLDEHVAPWIESLWEPLMAAVKGQTAVSEPSAAPEPAAADKAAAPAAVCLEPEAAAPQAAIDAAAASPARPAPAAAAAPRSNPMKSTLWASPMSPVLLLKCRISVEHVPDDAPPCTVLKVLARAKAQAKIMAGAAGAEAKPVLGRSSGNPFNAPVTAVRELTAADAVKTVWHMELDVTGAGWGESKSSFRPGDSFGCICANEAEHVGLLCARLGVRPEQRIVVRPSAADGGTVPSHLRLQTGEETTVRELLGSRLDINVVSKKSFLKMLSCCCEAGSEDEKTLLHLVSPAGREDYAAQVLAQRPSCLELLARFPACRPSLAQVLDLLPPLQPRFYSISCSPCCHPGAIHFAFTEVHYTTPAPHGLERHGLCTSQLARMCRKLQASQASKPAAAADSEAFHLKVFLSPSGSFHPPDSDDVPAIMVGPGTGVAPFVGFVQERARRMQEKQEQLAEGGGPAGEFGAFELYFGCRHASKDFLYQEELEAAVATGALSGLVTAFSRDGPEKVYVGHRLLENGAHVARQLCELGGRVYVCGDGSSMARDVHEALARILVEHGKAADAAAAKDTLAQWIKSGKYLRDVWS